MVAAGGGGDAITSAILGRVLGVVSPPTIMTYSWDRLMVDPMPGPRAASDFVGVRHHGPGTVEIVAETRARAPAGSSLPRLAATLPARLILLDPSRGALGMADQMMATAELFDLDHLTLVDVGGDVLTDGRDEGLRSPLADQLALAACMRTGLPTRLVIAAPSIDGELDPEILTLRLDRAHSVGLPPLTAADQNGTRQVFAWHPSEASGLLAAAVDGYRGQVEVRDAGDQVLLTDDTPCAHVVELADIGSTVPGASLTETRTLSEASDLIRSLTGKSELDYETAKAAQRAGTRPHVISINDLPIIDRHAHEAAERGADFISMRRLAELVGVSTLDAYAELSNLLAHHRPSHHGSSIYRTVESRSH
ncbi:MAG: DUF1152 domain-containing protein [Dermatophilaceae bacterium]